MRRASYSSTELQAGFSLGPWQVEPDRNTISNQGNETHLENRLMQTLLFLVAHQHEVVTREQFFDVVWRGRVVNEEALSRAISLLRTALSDDAHRPRFIQTIPGVGYRLIASVALGSSHENGGALPPEPDKYSIAVLPFMNLSADKANEYFSDGISEEILNSLAQVERFKVVGRTSSFAFKNQNTDLREIGKTLDVSHVLEGSVRKAGTQVRVTAQLIKVQDGYHLWSKAFDRGLEDIFAVQDEIAFAVVTELKVRLLGDLPKTRETTPEAYSLYLQGQHFMKSGVLENMHKALEQFKQSTQADESYAPAWIGLARTYWYLASYAEMSRLDCVDLAKAASAKALEIDSGLADAHVCNALILSNFDQNWPAARTALDRSLQLAPGDAGALLQAGYLATTVGKFEEGVEIIHQAITRDPLHTTGYIWYAISLMTLDRLEEARSSMQQVLNLNPDRVLAHSILGRILQLEGKPAEAHEEMKKEPMGFWRDYGMALSFYAIGDDEKASEALASMITQYAYEAPFQIAELYAQRGDVERAFEWLERAREDADSGLVALLTSRLLDNLYTDSRWPDFLTKMGLELPLQRHRLINGVR